MGNRSSRGKMEKHMAGTVAKFDRRIPDALRAAFGIYRYSWTGGKNDEAAENFAAALLAPRPRGDDASAASSSNQPIPMDCDVAEAEAEAEAEGDLGMVFASCYIKDHDEDAHFGHAEAGVIGEADGVGGYRREGVDASAYSRGLMHNAFAEVATNAAPGARFCPLALLECAHQMTAAAGTPGASTAVIVSIAGVRGRALKWAYVGDSGLAVLRDGRILRRSRPQQHHFNCPYQLSSDNNDDAAVGEVAAKEGDVVVLGTDGLFDNVSDDEVERIVRMGTALGFAPENMAEVLAGFAAEAACCDYRDTPYSSAAQAEQPWMPASFKGGKPDDITVVVAFIVSRPTQCQL